MFCNNCGKEVNEQEKFCRYCGATITNSNAESNMSFDIILTNAGTNRIKVINVITETTGMSLKEAKEIVDNAPKTLKHNVTKETAEDIKAKLAEVGADIELQHSIKTSNSTESQAEVKTEQKPNKKQSKKKMWQIAFTINFTVVAMAIIVALAMMDSDDNESIKNTTVATSTNAVETKNEATEQNYIANSEKKTNEEKSQQTATKDNTTTATTDKKNTRSNSLVEVSDVSMTGMRFNKTWSELKPKLEAYSEEDKKYGQLEWLSDKPYKGAITEYTMNYKGTAQNYGGYYTYNAFQIVFMVEDNSDKIIGMYLCVLKQTKDKNMDKAMKIWANILSEFDKSVGECQAEVFEKIEKIQYGTLNELVCFKDNVYAYVMPNETHNIYFVLASDNEEAQYHKQNGKWRKAQ